MTLDGFTFDSRTGTPPALVEKEEALARFAVMNREIGYGRMLEIIGDLWEQTGQVMRSPGTVVPGMPFGWEARRPSGSRVGVLAPGGKMRR